MNTPVVDFVTEYRDKQWSRFHMPGHKGHVFFGCEPGDITEIQGADVLHHGDGIIRESEKNASGLFGSGMTHYSTEGSTHCIKSMLAILLLEAKERKKEERPWILAARNIHRSMIDACALLDLDVHFLGERDASHLCSSVVEPEELESALNSVEHLPLGVYVTSPDYLGQQTDIRALADVCNKKEIPLLVDNAHGAYLHFLEIPMHPLDLGAAMCCDSAHKTLPVLTGGAYLHIHEKFFSRFEPYASQALSLFGSTSPSYLVMQSLDLCNRYLAEEYVSRLHNTIERIAQWKADFCGRGGTLLESEPLKIVIDTAGNGYTGGEIAEEMREYCIECEYEDEQYVVLMVTPENDERDWERMEWWSMQTRLTARKRKALNRVYRKRCITKRCMTIREAALAGSEKIPVEQAAGRICAAEMVTCPPAVPIAICGEVISEEMIWEFKKFDIKEVSVVL